jgi:chromosome segregation ATPase
MTELIMKMVLCLVVALILGLIIGWLLSKIAQSKKHHLEVDVLSNTLDDRNNHIEMLEKQFSEKETALLQYNHENRELKESLVEKSNNLLNIESKLKSAEEVIDSNQNFKNENERLQKQVIQFRDEAQSKTKELEELETVLVKAEETIEDKSNLLSDSAKKLATFASGVVGGLAVGSDTNDSDENLKKKIEELTLTNDEKDNSIGLYQNTISELENELKLYMTNGEEDEFIISKDQFTHIEAQLVDYQKEIKELKEDNSRLAQLSSNEKKTDDLKSAEMDDISIVKLFRETYKKITKS